MFLQIQDISLASVYDCNLGGFVFKALVKRLWSNMSAEKREGARTICCALGINIPLDGAALYCVFACNTVAAVQKDGQFSTDIKRK